jgi:hypothetical protein
MQRTLGIRDKQILHLKAGKKCENCGKTLEFYEMQVGHKKAASKGGNATQKNCVCLCYPCNKLQGTDDWITFQRKQGKTIESDKIKNQIKNRLMELNLKELKILATIHNIKVKGRIDDSFFETIRKPPSKKQYITKLINVVTEDEINSIYIEKEPITSIDTRNIKDRLKELNLNELKLIANKCDVKVKGRIEEIPFGEIYRAPSKKQYINKLTKIVNEEKINNALQKICQVN